MSNSKETHLETEEPKLEPVFTKKRILIGVAGVAAVGVAANFFTPEQPDFEQIPSEELDIAATEMFSDRLNDVDVRTRIAVQYGSLEGEITIEETMRDNETGELDYSPKDFIFGQNCLEESGFDLAPSRIDTWFGGGEINSNATVTAGPNGEVVLGSGSSADGVLRFEITELGSLMPFDEQTRVSLEFNGCDPDYDPLVDGPRYAVDR